MTTGSACLTVPDKRFPCAADRDCLRAEDNHWGVESRNHYCCEVIFGEDLSHICIGHDPANNIVLAIVRLRSFHSVPESLTRFSVQHDEVLDAIPKPV